MNLGSYGKTQLLIFHGALIIPALVSLGVLIVSHIPEGWEPTKKRKSGFLLSFIMLFLVISGFVLFYTDSVVYELSYSHSLVGLILVPLIFWHFTKKSALNYLKVPFCPNFTLVYSELFTISGFQFLLIFCYHLNRV